MPHLAIRNKTPRSEVRAIILILEENDRYACEGPAIEGLRPDAKCGPRQKSSTEPSYSGNEGYPKKTGRQGAV